MKLLFIALLIASGEGLFESIKAQRAGSSSPDVSTIKILEELILAKVSANEDLILKSVSELKSELNKIEQTLLNTNKELVIARENNEVFLSKYFPNICGELKPTEEQMALKIPSTIGKNGKETLSQSSVITILLPEISKLVKVRCETNSTGSEWTVILSRSSGEISFDRSYAEYNEGFGDPRTEYYLGNEALYYLTSWQPFELRIELEDFQGKVGWASYKHFEIGSAKSFYPLSIGRFDPKSSTGKEDGFVTHNGMKFSTFDKDNSGRNCSIAFGGRGGWWYNAGINCYNVLGTGSYRNKEGNDYGGISYWPWYDIKKSLKKFKLLIRPL